MEWLTELITTMHWGAVAQIIMIDILLGGDNAVVIALACRNLDPHQRRQGIFWGVFGAIALRVVLITCASGSWSPFDLDRCEIADSSR